MGVLEFVFVWIWFIRIVRNILSYVHLWYVKEYRVDRMIIHLRTKQGKTIVFPQFKKPPISPKTIFLVCTLVSVAAAIILFVPFNALINTAIADLLTFPLSMLMVLITHIPTKILHLYKISKAIRMLRAHKPMTVIGITGSYGKTSTKEFLTSILSQKYKVLCTQASKNSPIGISETVIRRLHKNHEVFVVEMGAYKRGEIKQMASIVRPQIGVITAINAQHQDLFKNIETTKKAKYELIEGLTGQQTAIINMDNPHTKILAKWAHRDGKKIFFVEKGEIQNTYKQTFAYSHISSTIDAVHFTIRYNNRTYPMKVKIRGEHFVTNIVLAISASVAAGMKFEEAVKIAQTRIKPAERIMELVKSKHGQNLINDTFNNNPDAAIAALNYLTKFTGKKFLVFQPMIELGEFARVSHEKVGVIAGKICDEIILTNSNFSEGFIKGVSMADRKKRVVILNADDAATYIQKRSVRNDTILFKGKEAEFVFRKLV